MRASDDSLLLRGCRLLRLAHAIAHAAYGMDQLYRKRIIHFASQMTHVHIDYIGDTFETLIPDMFKDHGTREHATRRGQQIFKQRVLLAGQLDVLSAPPHLASQAVDLEVRDQDHVGTLNRAAAKQ